MMSLELVKTYSISEYEKRIFIHNDLPFFDSPGGEESLPLSRRLLNDKGRT